MNSSRSIQGILVLVVSAFLAVWIGISLVTSQTETLLQVAVASLIAVCLALGRKVWLLMMFFIGMNIPLLSGFSSTELGQGIFIVFSVLLFLIRRLPFKLSFGEPEIWVGLIGLTILQAYLRNPVGLDILGSSSVGARPYFLVALSFTSAFILSTLVVPPQELRWAAGVSILGTYLGIPITEYRISQGLQRAGADDSDARMPWLNYFAAGTVRWLVAYISPFKTLLKPLLFFVLLLCLAAAALSGYRNSVAMVGLFLLVGVYYHHGVLAVLASLVAAAMTIALLAIINLSFPLPHQVQRTLSPFPGTWDQLYVNDAAASTEWRVEMWKEALFTEYWIQNKWLGDGLGFTKAELEAMLDTMERKEDNYRGTSGLTIQQENMMVSGGYHSGPVHTIRTVGYVGLAVLLLAMIRLAVYAHRQIRRCQNTEWAFVARFFGIPLIVLPIFFVFIFGDFGRDVAIVVMGFGMMRLFERNVPVPHLVRARSRFAAPPAALPGQQPANAFARRS